MNVVETAIPGSVIIEPQVFGDERGFFVETYNRQRYQEAGIDIEFVQDNLSFSQRGVLRGLHYQNPNPQGKLVQVLQGTVLDVAVDIRLGSPAFKRWVSVELSDTNKRQFYVPPGCAHGFVVLSETALFSYKCTDLYNPAGEGSLAWNDPELGIEWGIEEPSLSAKDEAAPCLADIDESRLIAFAGGN